MTPDEYRRALIGIGREKFNHFRRQWAGAGESIEDCVADFANSPEPERYERVAVMLLRPLGAELLTEEEKALLDLEP